MITFKQFITEKTGIKTSDGYIQPSIGMVVNYQGEYVMITRLSKSGKVYFKRSHYNGEYGPVPLTLLKYDGKFREAFGLK